MDTADRLQSLLLGLTEPQRLAVTCEEAPLCVLAGAGSGKTRVLTRRVARRVLDGSVQPDHALVVTFTRKAGSELRQRLGHLGVAGVSTGTFHAAAFAQLRRHWADRGIAPLTLLDQPTRLLRELLGEEALRRPGTVPAIAAEIDWAQATLLSPAGYGASARVAGRRPGVSPELVADAYGAYLEAKRRRGLLDLTDLLTRAAGLFADPTHAAALRWRVRHLFVDEFQDVNPAQWQLLRAWLGSGTDLFVVGDPLQAVYSWNGADPSLLGRLPELLPGTRVLRLDANHRSSPQILAAAGAVLAGSEGAADLRSAEGRPDGPAPLIQGFEDDGVEAAAVVRWLRLAHRPGRPWSHLAVLARTNARLEPVVDALRRAGVPFHVRSGPGQADLAESLRALRKMPPDRPLRSALADLAEAPGTDPDTATPDPTRGLAALADELALDEPDPTVGAFLGWLAATVGDPTETGEGPWRSDRVEVATFHRAKGLEWPVVAVVGLEDGLVPISYASTPGAEAEERRLLYVALTRTEEELWCSWAAVRGTDAGGRRSGPSPFLGPLEALSRAARPAAPPPGQTAARIAELRRRLPSPTT